MLYNQQALRTILPSLRLLLDPMLPKRCAVGDALPITGTLETEDLPAGGAVRIEVNSEYLDLLSPDTISIPPGRCALRIEWSVGAIASTRNLPGGETVVAVNASANGLAQTAEHYLSIVD